jgi:putative hydrolase of the HAD superfamily
MAGCKAIGFDLFNTLITLERQAFATAVARLVAALNACGLEVPAERFDTAHREAALSFILQARESGLETHNRFWIAAALSRLGWEVDPGDERIARAVEAYFSAFLEHARLIPETLEMLGSLGGRYRLGLLSNFTHAPAARAILDRLGLTPFFEALLISGDLGYRKPHASVFNALCQELAMSPGEILYVGDDPEADVDGALEAGLASVWMTYVRDNNIPQPPSVWVRHTSYPEGSAQRVSDWADFLAWLEGSEGTTPRPSG